MEAEKVTEKILAEAKAEADKIKKQAEQNQANEQKKLDEQLAEFKKQTKTLAEKAAKDEKSHILAAQRMAAAKQLLAEKSKILDEVFEKALKQLQSLPDDQYQNLITKLMLEAVETGEEEVIIDKNEKRIDQQLIDKVNEQLSSDKKSDLKLSDEKQDIEGGFILRRGKIKTNVTFDVLLNNVRKELEIDLAKQLFAN
jgi:V/A-type H+-transporting ATPase subunit E